MQKYLNSYYFQTDNFLVKFNKSWRLKYINWNYDKVMRKAYRWSLFIGPIELTRYQSNYE